jgi:HEAT repeat protein
MTKPDHKTEPGKPTFEGVLAKLAKTDKDFSNSEIAALSLASPEDKQLFARYWVEMAEPRKAQVLGRMLELAEEDANLDFSPLYRILLEDPLAPVRAGAIQGLWENEDPSLIRRLIPLMENDPDAGVRAAAAQGLCQFVLMAEHGKLRREIRDQLLEKLLAVFGNSEETDEVRRRALESVSFLSCPEVRQAILDSYDSPDPFIRGSALFAAGRNLDPGWLDMLLDELSSDNPEHRYEAVVACGEYEDELAVPQLIRLTLDADVEIKMAAITALGKIGGAEGKQHLRDLTESDDSAVAEMAVQALNDMVTDDEVMDLLADENGPVQGG